MRDVSACAQLYVFLHQALRGQGRMAVKLLMAACLACRCASTPRDTSLQPVNCLFVTVREVIF